MNKQFDRWVLVSITMAFAAVAVYGYRIGNSLIASFGVSNFTLFSGALLIMLNRELSNGNGNGKTNSNGTPAPAADTEEHK